MLYKYTEKFVADLLFNENCIRIGTLNGFKNMESKKGISDPLEGSYKDKLSIDYFTEKDLFNNPLLRRNIGSSIQVSENSGGVVVIGGQFNSIKRSPNYLIFCSAHTKSSEVMEQFEGADTCFHIYKARSFFLLITWALEKKFNKPVKFLGAWGVNYDEYDRQRSGMNSRPLHPALAKTKEFSSQCEVRAIWEVPEDCIKESYYDLKILGLRKFCRIVDL